MSRVFRTANFRLTLLFAVIFISSVLVLASIVYYAISRSLEDHLKQRVQAESIQLLGDYQEDGIQELQHDIRERIRTNSVNRLYYYLKSPEGKIIFDNLNNLPLAGWHVLSNADGKQIILYVSELKDDFYLGIAADTSSVEETKDTIIRVFLSTCVFIIIFAFLGGIVVSQRFLKRIDQIARTAKQIGEGQLTERIEITGANDDFDQLSSTINGMLDKIENLVANIKQVSTNLAHDLRTPLGHIRQRLENLNSASVDNQEIGEIIAALDEVLSIFSSILRIAEIESGQRRRGFAKIDCSDLAKKLAETYAPIIEDSARIFRVAIAEGCFVNGDKSLLTQLLVNLLENAIQHTPLYTIIFLEITTNGHLQICVSDNGLGIAPEEIQQVTHPFYRTDGSRTTKGSGLGLNLVKAITELHGGTITLSNNHPGLKVTICLPTHQG